MDFLQEIISEDREMQTIIVALEPVPRKYEWREVEDDDFELAKRVIGEPVYHELNDAHIYDAKSRRLLIVKMQKTME